MCVCICFDDLGVNRLNHDTASYRGKFENENAVPQKGANVMTLKGLTKNGFISSATRAPAQMAAKAAEPAPAYKPNFNSYDEKPLKKWEGGSVKHGTGLIDMLQAATSGAAQASLKHAGKLVAAEKKPLAADQYTKYAL